MSNEKNYKDYINEIQDFPKEGVSFKDISPLLLHPTKFKLAMMDIIQNVPFSCFGWAGVESRGFLIASALSQLNGGGIVLIRKKGKLPPPTKSCFYQLEYATATLEMKEGSGKVVIVDDVLATGGTLRTTNLLAEKSGYDVIGNLVLMDLQYVPLLDNFDLEVKSLLSYE